MSSTTEIEHKTYLINGLNMHAAHAGHHGPTIIFLHGFPQCWYTWRHQMSFFAAHGFRAVAPDLRGYADTATATTSTSDDSFTKFTSLHLVGDVVSLIDAVAAKDEDKVFVVGHDWGALVAWALCLYRGDRVRALVNLSVVFNKRNPSMKPIETLKAVYGDDYYICRFQEPGQIEKEFAEIGIKNVLKNFITYHSPNPVFLPKERAFPDKAISLPSWLTEEDVDYYTSKYEASGFTGALNYYRALDLNWELTAPWTGAKVTVPTKFIVGDVDITYNAPGTKNYIHKGGFKKDVPLLKEVVVMEGVGHFVNEEKPDEVNRHIYSFFKKVSSTCSAW